MLTIDIGIRRKLAVTNGFVDIPDGQRFLRTKLTALDVLGLIPGSTLIRMGARNSSMASIQVLDPTSYNLRGSGRMGERLYIQLPEYDRLDGPVDWFTFLRAVANIV